MLRLVRYLVCTLGLVAPALVPTAAHAMLAVADVSPGPGADRPPLAKRTHHPKRKTTPKPTPTASTPTSSDSTDPLAGGPWGIYKGSYDDLWPAYERAGGTNRELLAKIALQPRVRWYHSGISVSELGAKIRDEIAQQTAGNPDTLVQLAWFRLWPNGGEGGRNKPLSQSEQDDYRRAVDVAADAIGDARTAIILEPDLALTAPPMRSGAESTADPRTRQSLVAYAAERFSKLPRTSVYLDAGDADWLSIDKAVDVLRNSGVGYARGFALGATHYSSVAMNVSYGVELVHALEQAGVGTKHFVVDTADNGRAFTYAEYFAKHPGGDFNNAQTCGSEGEEHCDTLGPAPTWHVDEDGIGLSDQQKAEAATYVDGYLWFGRPWLVNQAAPFSLDRALQVARTTPYDQTNVTGG